MNGKLNALFALSLTLAGTALAQDDSTKPAPSLSEQIANVDGKVDGLNESYLETKATVDKMSHLTFGGYIQAQYQYADSTPYNDSASLNGKGIPTVAGGSIPGQTNQRFQIRRARLKATYTGNNTKYVLELDGSVSNGVTIKDAYAQFTEPWFNTVSLTLGNMDRPFGYEIGYSSAAMEWPERSRLENNIFKGEKDLGAKIEINPTDKMGMAQFFNLKAGLYTGTEGGNGLTGTPAGVVTLTPGDQTDKGYDFIGHLGFKAPMSDLGLDIDGGVSMLYGKDQTANDSIYTVSGDTAFIGTKGNKPAGGEWKYRSRTGYGADLQLYYDIPVIGGLSLRGEYVQGQEPGIAGGSVPYALSTAPMYVRNYEGWYLAWIQNLGDKFQTVIRYDEYDPNTDVTGSAIGDPTKKNTNLGIADLKFDTWGFGLTYYYDGNLKFLAYYDIPMNEKINSAAAVTTGGTLYPYRGDIDDNVLTLRMQVKF